MFKLGGNISSTSGSRDGKPRVEHASTDYFLDGRLRVKQTQGLVY